MIKEDKLQNYYFRNLKFTAMKIINALISLHFLLFSFYGNAQILIPGYTRVNVLVGENGQAVADSRLELPKGARITPSLSIVYNHQGKEWIGGGGVNIEGLFQSITRSQPTLAGDGRISSMINDPFIGRYIKDGQPLKATFNYSNATQGLETDSYLYSAPWGDGMRMESDDFSKVIVFSSGKGQILGDASHYADSFRVYEKDGLVYDFGTTPDSRIEVPGTSIINTWLLNKISDRNGNYLLIRYEKDAANAAYYPVEIVYTGNAKAKTLPYAKIIFQYEARPDSIARYAAGYAVKYNRRLSSISSFDHGNLFRKYVLSYASENGLIARSKLIKITEFGFDAQTTIRPVTFQWQAQPVTPGFSRQGSGMWAGNAATPANTVTADFNNDGKADFAGYTGANGSWHVSLSTGSGFINSFWQAHVSTGVSKLSGDFNGDSYADLAGYSAGKWQISLSTGKNFSTQDWSGTYKGPAFTKMYVLDINGDGLSDILGYSGSGTWHQFISTGSSFAVTTYNDGCTSCNGTVLIGDFDGDAKSEAINASALSAITNVAISNCIVGDVNGDGLHDIIGFAGNSQWKVSISKGFPSAPSFITTTWTAHNNGIANNTAGDVNQDGMTDLITYLGSNNYGVYLSNGNSFKYAGTWKAHAGGMVNNILTDVNGDGAMDMIGYTVSGGQWHVTLSNSERELVTQIVSGYNNFNYFTYTPITNQATYQKAESSTYPDIDFASPLYVVSSLRTDDGMGGAHNQVYTYGNAKFNLRGRGFRGFGRVTVTDSLANTVYTTWYSTDYKNSPTRVLGNELRTLSNKLLAKTQNFISVKTRKYAKDSTFFAYYNKTIDSSFESDGSFIKSKITENTVDDFGNVVQVMEMHSNGLKVTTSNTYQNDNSTWMLGILTSSVTKTEMPGKPSITKDVYLAYNSEGVMIQEIRLKDHPVLRLQTDFIIDAFGNKTAIWVSAPRIATRTTVIKYDTDGRNIVEVRDAMGNTTSTRYRLGLPDTLIDINNLATIITRDQLGRIINTRYANGVSLSTAILDCTTYPLICQSGGSYATKEQLTGQGAIYKIFDKFDREIKTVTEGFNNSVIYRDRIYNRDGTLQRESNPYFSTATPSYIIAEYDSLKRLVREMNPFGAITYYTYSGLSNTTIDALRRRTTKTENAQGKLVKITDAYNSELLFDHDADLNPITVTDPKGNKITMQYDLNGNKIYMKDPDMGEYRYEYNALNQLLVETDPKGNVIKYSYDLLGRLIERVEKEGTVQWKYDAPNAKDKIYQIYENGILRQQNYYDGLSRLVKRDYRINSQVRTFQYVYNSTTGELLSLILPNNVLLTYAYSAGYLSKVTGLYIRRTPIVLWTALSYNQYGQVSSYKLGNNVVTKKTIDDRSGFLTCITAGIGDNAGKLQNLSYQHDKSGNISSRQDLNFGLTEYFSYDELDRLTESKVYKLGVPGSFSTTLRYDALGNIIYKSDVGNYRYGEYGRGPHTLTTIDNAAADSCAYAFDQQISYTSYNYVSKISKQFDELEFKYGPEREQEVLLQRRNGVVVQTRNNYSGLYEEIFNGSSDTVCNYYVKAGSEVIAMVSGIKNKLKDSITYPLTDHLGSIYALTDEQGAIRELVSYDSWGRPRDPMTWKPYASDRGGPSFNRGYTFHEQLHMDFLVSMGARVYNSVLGRFLSPDPLIQFPDNLQSYNRYSYVLNNPLSYTDPSGYFSLKKFLKKIIPIVVSIALSSVTFGTLGVIGAGAAGGFGAGFTSGILNGQGLGGSLKLGLQAGIQGAFTAGATAGIDRAFPNLLASHAKGGFSAWERYGNQLVNSTLRNTVNGAIASANGTSFRKAFFNSMFWEGVSVANAEIIINNTAYTKKEWYNDANPTFQRGEEANYQRPKTMDALSTNPHPNNLGLSFLESMSKPIPWNVNGSDFMKVVNFFPGMNYHANMHDAFVSMLYKTSSIFKDNAIANKIANYPTQVVMIANYATILNRVGMLSAYQNGIK